MNRESITVTALNRYVKSLLESDEVLSQIWVEGEISSFKLHTPSGHMYFRLIDGHCGVKCVMFYSNASKLKFMPKDGMKVLVNCSVSLYEATGDFQLYVRDIIEKGEGKRKQDLDILKEKLQKMGLFDSSRKKRLPPSPNSIAVITSESGAAIKDIFNVISRRNPLVRLQLYPVNVQGAFAVDTICSRIDDINNCKNDVPDLVIIARGGGSKDDLWIFNEERLILKAASLKVPFISAVGHEIDFSLLDFVADLRAPTPSAAAELAVPDLQEALIHSETLLNNIKGRLLILIQNKKDNLTESKNELNQTIDSYIDGERKELDTLEKSCYALSPVHILQRGYTFVKKGDGVLSHAADASVDDKVAVVFSDGQLNCIVKEVIRNE